MTCDLDIPKLIELFKSYTEIINTLWTLLSTVALAMLGFLYKDGEPTGKKPLKLVLTIAFALFAGGNCTAIHRHQAMLFEMSRALQKAAPHSDYGDLLRTFIALPPSKIIVVHILFSLAAIALIWVPGWWLTKSKASQERLASGETSDANRG